MRARLVAAIVVAITLCGCVPIEDTDAAMLPPGQTEVTEHANGMPLDAISYDPPAWLPECYKAYRIYDRTNGQQWWVLAIDDYGVGTDWVVLPIGDGNDTI